MNRVYSVLIPVYYKENPEFFKQSLDSVINQTVFPNEIVIVKDGKLTEDLDNIINFYSNKYNNLFNIVSIEKNVGLGKALNIGMKACKNNIIARMDSDDISLPNRCEQQLKVFDLFSDIGIVGCSVNEFDGSIDNITSSRVLPENHEDIVSFSKKRCPFNHPSVMYKKNLVENAGGYKHFIYFEDYFLWIRMINNGVKCYNIKAPLLFMRAGNDMYKRRGGFSYFKNAFSFRKYLLKIKYCSLYDFIFSVTAQFFICIIPNSIRQKIYKKILRK